MLLAILIVAGLSVAVRWKASLNRAVPSNVAICGVPCGTERWAVKTLSDDGVGCIDFRPKPTTISSLVSQPTPERMSGDLDRILT